MGERYSYRRALDGIEERRFAGWVEPEEKTDEPSPKSSIGKTREALQTSRIYKLKRIALSSLLRQNDAKADHIFVNKIDVLRILC